MSSFISSIFHAMSYQSTCCSCNRSIPQVSALASMTNKHTISFARWHDHAFPTPVSDQGPSNSLRQTAHSHRASVHQAAKLVASILRVAKVTADLAESNGSLPPLYDSHHLQADPGISSGTLRSVIEYGLPLPF